MRCDVKSFVKLIQDDLSQATDESDWPMILEDVYSTLHGEGEVAFDYEKRTFEIRRRKTHRKARTKS